MPPARLQVGQYALLAPLGHGATGQVWLAAHGATRREVAIKLLTHQRASRPEFVRLLRREVVTMARLGHSAIARVYEFGELDRAAGEFAANTPYIVMEHVAGRALHTLIGSLGWPEIRRVLFDLLDALAHAHARGIVHRDLKPRNIIRASDDGACTLLDFGIAYDFEQLDLIDELDRVPERARGTPKYMAPEQVIGRWRAQGPWTDLYALGCLGWALATGLPPFHQGSAYAILRAHARDEPGPFSALCDLPPGFEAWLRVLLRKDPRTRFLRAADAAHALRELDAAHAPAPPSRAPLIEPPAPGVEEATVLLVDNEVSQHSGSLGNEISTQSLALRALGRGARNASGGAPRAPAGAPIQASWRPARPPPEPGAAADLGMWGARATPLVGRLAERDALWSALRAVHGEARPRAVYLSGPAGRGKSRLARWLAERAHETGAASVWRVHHTASSGGLGYALTRALTCYGLDRPRAKQELEQRFPRAPFDVDALVEWMVEGTARGQGSAPLRRFHDARERFGALRQFIAHRTAERPLILWIDDAHWGDDAVEFTRFMLGARPLPVLFVLTAREVSGSLARLLACGEVEMIALDPLAAHAHREMVDSLIALDPALAAELSERTLGDPLFAVQLVGEWVQRGALVPTKTGYRLRPGARSGFAESLSALWKSRILQATSRYAAFADRALRSLEIAAALGAQIDPWEWEQACALSGAAAPSELVDDLIAAGLAEREESGWSIAHHMARDALETIARRAGRWRAHHRAIARVFDAHPDRYGDPRRASRLAHHLLEAGDDLQAARVLCDAADAFIQRGELDAGRATMKMLGTAIGRLDAARRAAFSVREATLRGTIAALEGRAASVEAEADELVDRAERLGLDAALAGALELRASVHGNAARFDEAVRDLDRAAALYTASGDELRRARVLTKLGRRAVVRGRAQRARAMLERASQLAERASNPSVQGEAHLYLMNVEHDLARDAAAQRAFERTIELARSAGDRMLEARAHNMMGNLSAEKGRWEEARRAYKEASRFFEVSSEMRYLLVQSNLGFLDAVEERWASCRARMEEILARIEELEMTLLRAGPIVALMCVCAHERDWPAFDRYAAEVLQQRGLSEATAVLELIEKGARRAIEAGEGARALELIRRAKEAWRELGREARARSLESLLATIA